MFRKPTTEKRGKQNQNKIEIHARQLSLLYCFMKRFFYVCKKKNKSD